MDKMAENGWRRLRTSQKVFVIVGVIVILLPPTIVMTFDLPPAVWLEAQEGKILGGYYLPKLTWVVLTAAYALILLIFTSIIAAVLRLLTGRTIVQLLGGGGLVQLINVTQQGADTYADLCVPQEWIQNGKMVGAKILNGRWIQVRLDSTMSAGSKLRLRGKAPGGGDLHLCVQISN